MSIIKVDDIKKGYEMCKTNDYFTALKNLYRRVPATKCNCCGSCCSENPGGSFVEFLNFLNFIVPKEEKKEILENAIRNNMTKLAQPIKCIFLKDNQCSIYVVRPLACRTFGLESESAFEQNYKSVSEGNDNIKAIFKNMYGIDVYDNPKLNYCNNVKPIKKIPFNDRDVEKLFIDLANTEAKFHKKGFKLNEAFESYEGYLAYLVCEELNIDLYEWAGLRVTVFKEIKEHGKSDTLEELIIRVNSHDFSFLKPQN